MAERILMAVTKSILEKFVNLSVTSVADEIIAAKAVRKDLKKMQDKLSAISAVLQDAELRQYANESIKVWLRDLKRVVYDIDDLLDRVATDSVEREVSRRSFLNFCRYYFSTSNPIICSFQFSNKMKDLRLELDELATKKNEFGLTERLIENEMIVRSPLDASPYLNTSDIIGRGESKKDVISRLKVASDTCELCVLPIVGIGGVGKTALAKLVYHDDEWVAHNFDIKLWASVSTKFDLQKIIEDVVKSAIDDNMSNKSLEKLVGKLHDVLNEKKYLLVLDDVWEENILRWTDLMNILRVGAKGSAILITTRYANVASIAGTIEQYNLCGLEDEVCFSVFKQLAFSKGEEFRYPNLVETGRSIAHKCCGVPLVVRTLASLLRNVRDEREWRRVDEMKSFVELNKHYADLMRVLKLSYDKLPPYLKPFFGYCSLFVKASKLTPLILSYYWSALGLLEPVYKDNDNAGIGYTRFTELIARSLLQKPYTVFDETVLDCEIHDLLHDLAMNVMGDELAVVTYNKLNISSTSRYIVWGHEERHSLSEEEFPRELLQAKKARAFIFGYKMGSISQSFLESIISNFSCLRILNLSHSQFQKLPQSVRNLKHLRYLDLRNNTLIRRLPEAVCKLVNLQTLLLYGCQQLEEIPKNVDRLLSLSNFTVTTNQMSLVGTRFNRLRSLQGLVFYSCPRLQSLWDGVSLLTSIRRLDIVACPKLACLPNSMKALTALEQLYIQDCDALDLNAGEALCGLQSLQKLGIVKVPKLVDLPSSIQSAANTLQYLVIRDCNSLVKLPDWMHHLTSLRKIRIHCYSELVALPKKLCNLKSMQFLEIKNCPRLETQYMGATISNLPNIIVDEDWNN